MDCVTVICILLSYKYRQNCINDTKANQDNEAGPSWKNDNSDIDYTDKEKELLDYVVERHQMGVFEMFNILASKIGQNSWTKRFAELIIKEGLNELD